METLLDEATAELGKLEFSPMLATIEISFRIVKAVPLHTTLRIDCEARVRFRRADAQGFPQSSTSKGFGMPCARPVQRDVCMAIGLCLPRPCCFQLGCINGLKDLPTALQIALQ